MKKILPYIIWFVVTVLLVLIVMYFVAGVPWVNLLKPKITWAFEK